MQRKYKVIHLVEHCDLAGGLERVVYEIAGGLDKDKFEVELWCLDKGGFFAEEIRKNGIPVRVLNIHSYHNPMNIIKLAKALKEAKPDILHSHIYFASTVGRIAAFVAGIRVRVIIHVHSSYWHYSPVNILIEKALSLMTDRIICVSKSVRTFVVDHEKIDEKKSVVVYNGITRREISRTVHAREVFVISVVAFLLEVKGHRYLLEAIALLKDKHPAIKCWLIGDGPMAGELKSLARQLGISQKTIFWGVRDDVPEMLSSSDLFVLPSLAREGLSVSIIEAMAYGVPVVATCVGGIPEIVEDGRNGCLVPPKDPAVLAGIIDRLIRDPEKRRQMAQAGRQTYEQRLSAKSMIARIEEIYTQCVTP